MAKEGNLRGRIRDGVCSIEVVGSLVHSDLEVAWSVFDTGVGEVEAIVVIAWRLERGKLVCWLGVWGLSCLWRRGA